MAIAAVEILNEDANAAVQRICRQTDWRSNRAVLFPLVHQICL